MRILVLLFVFTVFQAQGQFIPKSFGEGLNFTAVDSSFALKVRFRIQTLMNNEWDIRNDDLDYIENHSSNFLLRRVRLKLEGFVYSPRLTYKFQAGFSNNDLGGGNSKEFNFSPRIIVDAYLNWNFYKNFSIQIGQGVLPGNRENTISSGSMQLVDRSLLNSRYNLDRDIGLQLKHNFKIGNRFIINETFAFSKGEGRNVTVANIGGYGYTFRLEFLPFGKFLNKGEYVGGAIAKEEKPKLAIAATYDINDKAVRERGQLGNFIRNIDGSYAGKTLNTLFIDAMFKYKNLVVMGEFADKRTADNDAKVYDYVDHTTLIGSFYTGTGFNFAVGWMFPAKYELTARYTNIKPTNNIKPIEDEYTIGLSYYIVDHNLKVQTDLNYRQNGLKGSSLSNNGRDDKLFWRFQIEIQF